MQTHLVIAPGASYHFISIGTGLGYHQPEELLTGQAMATDLRTFLDIYAQPPNGSFTDRDSYEFRYGTAALLIACAKADQKHDADEERVIIEILKETFELSSATLASLLTMAKTVTDDDLTALTDLVNQYYQDSDKRFLLVNLWRVADADGRIDKYEQQFIRRIAALINMTTQDINQAHDQARNEAAP
ncbi:MAG: TerB family tellurite resistance protein [Pseudomonadales bacterium]